MGSCSYSAPPRPPSSIARITRSRCQNFQYPISLPTIRKLPKTPLSNPVDFSSLLLINTASSSTQISATLRSPRGFGAPKRANKKKKSGGNSDDKEEDNEEEEEDEEDRETQGIIPEIVTNRMMKRMALSVGIPLSVGLMFFPLFYYLKVVLKIDVPNWVPFIVSFAFFGSALLGVSYGIVSSSWDPMREGSLLGWNEAQKNWPVFWQSLRSGGTTAQSRKK